MIDPHGKIVKNLVGILMVRLPKMVNFGEISTFLDPENDKNRVFRGENAQISL